MKLGQLILDQCVEKERPASAGAKSSETNLSLRHAKSEHGLIDALQVDHTP
jgi:hypothetical protein